MVTMEGQHVLEWKFAADVAVEHEERFRVFGEIIPGERERSSCEARRR